MDRNHSMIRTMWRPGNYIVFQMGGEKTCDFQCGNHLRTKVICFMWLFILHDLANELWMNVKTERPQTIKMGNHFRNCRKIIWSITKSWNIWLIVLRNLKMNFEEHKRKKPDSIILLLLSWLNQLIFLSANIAKARSLGEIRLWERDSGSSKIKRSMKADFRARLEIMENGILILTTLNFGNVLKIRRYAIERLHSSVSGVREAMINMNFCP